VKKERESAPEGKGTKIEEEEGDWTCSGAVFPHRYRRPPWPAGGAAGSSLCGAREGWGGNENELSRVRGRQPTRFDLPKSTLDRRILMNGSDRAGMSGPD
jgi:hypothetical protein